MPLRSCCRAIADALPDGVETRSTKLHPNRPDLSCAVSTSVDHDSLDCRPRTSVRHRVPAGRRESSLRSVDWCIMYIQHGLASYSLSSTSDFADDI